MVIPDQEGGVNVMIIWYRLVREAWVVVVVKHALHTLNGKDGGYGMLVLERKHSYSIMYEYRRPPPNTTLKALLVYVRSIQHPHHL